MGISHTSLFTEAVCDDCQAGCRDRLVADFDDFWNALPTDAARHDRAQADAARGLYTVAVLKALVSSALLIMPESELPYFVDTLEWVNNPDHGRDDRLFTETVCQLYVAPSLRGQSDCSLARRIDTDLALPYMIYFLSRDGRVLQVHIPLCLRDLDLDGRPMQIPERPVIEGEGRDFQEIRSTTFRLVTSGSRPRLGSPQRPGRP